MQKEKVEALAKEEAMIAQAIKKREQERREAENTELKKQKKMQEQKRMLEEYSPLEDSLSSDDDSDDSIAHVCIEALNHYTYFDSKAIYDSLNLLASLHRAGEDLYNKGIIDEIQVSMGYETSSYGYVTYDGTEPVGEAIWQGQVGRMEIRTAVYFTRNAVHRTQCTCPECKNRYGWYWDEQPKCKYVAGILIALRDFLNTRHNFGDATDWNANKLLFQYEQKRQNHMIADKTAKEESLILKPRLVKKDGNLTLSFKIGTNKLFVIKELDTFCENVHNAATATYGSNTQLNHKKSNFTDEGRKWLRFIERIVQEEEEFCQRLEDAARTHYYYRRSAKVGGSLNMFGWRLDEFYKELSDETVDYEDRDLPKTKKAVLRRKEATPCITLQIEEAVLNDSNGMNPPQTKKVSKKSSTKKASPSEEFHGIQVNGHLPELYFGTDCAYYINDNYFCKSSEGFQEKIETLAEMADREGNLSFRVGRNYLSEFYYQILPELQDIAEVHETNPDRIHSFLVPPVNFVFYLDAYDDDVQCKPFARYEQQELPLLDFIRTDEYNILDNYRNFSKEQETLYNVMTWLPQVDLEQDELNCGRDEERIYQMMTDGVNELLTLGEVQCTNRFKARRKIRPVKISVGVSVSGGLLDLDITTDDVPPEELLDILDSYRDKKNYYRLKDGSYVDLDEQSLDLLSELMDSMHVKPKDFVKGKMHLPLYRTLYLNKMLEENDSVYSDRDSHFREMVKGFKTISDADFDVPASLAKVMRKYQKNGYKWLRTLETWQFGGILADDMGLGKTLQIIALLLSAKERSINTNATSIQSFDVNENSMATASIQTTDIDAFSMTDGVSQENAPTSLVVAPASLVFNWGEEFARFAPELNILLITGTQSERRDKIASCQNYDVAVTSYDLLKRDIHLYEDMEFTYEVIDEAQYIKNHTTAAAKAVKVVKSRYRFALTGTPIENRLSELWSIFDFLMPGFLYSYEIFKREIETPIVKYQDETAIQRLQKMTSPFILRRLKENVLKDLPDKLEEVRYVHLDKKQQQLYDGQVLHMRELIGKQDADEVNRIKLSVLTER
ncbi:MAG: SNF2 helicase associated domain-containing protein, partial [Clostridiales bacterium]|nr:SNF2 helicase associated domain-containing protein [Clostridiales bacterium]